MKKLLIILLLFSNTIFAQFIKIPDKEYTTATVGVDPTASFKEHGLNFITELTLVSYWGYVKAGIQMFPGLTGNYYDITGGAGFNQESSIFNIETRLYQGIRLGFNHRNQTADFKKYTGPHFGMDFGVEFKLSENSSIGGRFTNDWREDMLYSGAIPKFVQSGFLTYTCKLSTL
jgi:hypothetical protein